MQTEECREKETRYSADLYLSLNSKELVLLGETIGRGNVWPLDDGSRISDIDCFKQAIILDENNASAYFRLGSALDDSVSIVLTNNAVYRGYELILRSIEIDPDNASGDFYYGLGIKFPKGTHSLRGSSGVMYTRQLCFLKCIEKRQCYVKAYVELALMIPQRGVVVLDNGRRASRLELLMEAEKIDPTNADLHVMVGAALHANEVDKDVRTIYVGKHHVRYEYVSDANNKNRQV